MTIKLEGYIDDGHGLPLEGIAATVTTVVGGTVVETGATGPDGRWEFAGLPEADEYFVTMADGNGNAVVRGPWSGELRTAWVRDRLALPDTATAVLPNGGNTTVGGLPLVIDPDAGNTLEWSAAGLFAAGMSEASADTRYVNAAGTDTKTGRLNLYEATTGDFALVVGTAGTPTNYFLLQADGTMSWGLGASYDTVLARSSAGVLSMSGSPLLTEATGNALFLTQAEGDARYPLLTAPDPYPIYLTQAEADTLYASAAGSGITQAQADLRYIQLTGGSVLTGLLGPTTTNTRDLGTTALRWRKLWAVDGEFTNAPTVGGAALLTQTTADALFLTPAEGNAAYATTAHAHDAAYVNVTGDTMTGALTLSGAAAAGRVIVSAFADPALPTGYTAIPGVLVQHEGSDTNGLSLARASSATSATRLTFWRARGTWASKVAIASADHLNEILAFGWSGANWLASSSIRTTVTGTVTTTAVPGALVLGTADSAGTLTDRLYIAANGLIGTGGRADGTGSAYLDVQASTASFITMIVRAHSGYAATTNIFQVLGASSTVSLGACSAGWITDLWSGTAIGTYATKRIPVYNSTGTLQGYLPLYT